MGEALDRVLCGDDMCTGLYGPDGRCGTCGRGVYEDDPPALRAEVAALMAASGEAGQDAHGAEAGAEVLATPEAPSGSADDADTARGAEAPKGAAVEVAAPTEGMTEGHDDPREPCADDMCTGIYNAQGECGTCGRPKG